MRLFNLFLALCVATAAIAAATPNECYSYDKTDEPIEAFLALFNFGMDQGNGDTSFIVPLSFGWSTCCSASPQWNTNQWLYIDWNYDDGAIMDSLSPPFVNGLPVIGGRNWTTYANSYIPLASHTCSNNNQTSMWGPAYPDYSGDNWVTGRYPNIEIFTQWHVPQETSYMRQTLFITNKGASTEKLLIQQTGYTNPYGANDISPANDGRYMILLDRALDDPNIDSTYQNSILTSIHARGANARDNRAGVYMDNDDGDYGWNYAGQLEVGETKALMFVYAFGLNASVTLEKAAWVDEQKPELFSQLTADQLSQIVNWDACQIALGPDVNVTITPPTTCSSGLTSDFTVKVDTAREDFTADFMHRVILAAGDVTVVAPTSSTTLSVVNDVGALTHQLWYNGCVVKQTAFTACAKVEAPVATAPSASVPVATPAKKSDATLLSVSAASLIALALF